MYFFLDQNYSCLSPLKFFVLPIELNLSGIQRKRKLLQNKQETANSAVTFHSNCRLLFCDRLNVRGLNVITNCAMNFVKQIGSAPNLLE